MGLTQKQGLLITFEGIDGSGKSTQLALCAQALQASGQSVVITRNPGGTPFGMELREILLHSKQTVFPMSELLLFIADRAQHMDEVVFPALAQGKMVLCDRHMDSTLAYQGYGRGLSIETIQELNQIAIQGKKPDLTLLFDADPHVLAQRVTQRGQADRLEGEKAEFHRKVREGFLALAQQEPERIHIFNALDSQQALHQQVMQVLAAQRQPLKTL
ncbi:dTMP kinase [Vampirovibrio sp.]|uniref:dTMP kinase n=1 Tax=Vampirovibrio sp. TaxID=2717857 RepID=UPI0035941416